MMPSTPHARVLAALELLQSRGQLSGAELAVRLQVDRRTVRRYVETLEAIGVPVLATRGRDGGYALMPSFKLPPMMFSNDEALALGVGLQAAKQLGLAGAVPAVASAFAKLERVMPDALKLRVRAIDETVAIDAQRARQPIDAALLAVLTSAAQRQQTVELVYQGLESEPTTRRANPYGLAYYSGSWYLVAWCHLRNAMRSFRLDRMATVKAVGASFARPKNFDALTYLKHSVAQIPRAHSFRVLLNTDLATAQRTIHVEFGALEYVSSGERSGVRVTGQAVNLNWLARELAALPFDFEIETPAALRTQLRKLATRLTQFSEARRR